jgi:hypothetical protein
MNNRRLQVRQTGVALLLMLLTLIIFVGTFVVYSSDDAEEMRIDRQAQTARALAQAKEKLLAFILLDAVQIKVPPAATPRIGEFPCPDTNNDGSSNGGGACQDIGWFPWKTLELEDLRDSSDSRLWYAVAPDFQDSGNRNAEPQLNSLTWDTIGHFRVEDVNAVQHRVAAVIIAPGAALSMQNRSASDNVAATVIGEYLEGENGDGDDLFLEPAQPGENDEIVYITVDEVKESVTDFAMRTIAAILRDYYDDYGFYPFPEFDTECDNLTAGTANKAAMLPLKRTGDCPYNPVLNMPAWFKYSTLGPDPDTDPDDEDGQGWDDLIVYMVAPACAGNGTVDCNGGGGLLTFNGQAGIQAMIADPGPPLDNTLCNGAAFDQTQPRVKLAAGSATPADRLCEFLDTSESTNDDAVFSEPPVSATMNDRFLIVSP